MHFRIGFFTLTLIATLFAATYSSASTNSVTQPVEQIVTPSALCSDLVAQAEAAVGQLCSGLGRNVACYGNRTVSVDFRPDSNVQFNASGDIVNLLDVQSLSTTPLNPQTKDWGIAILKAQTNLPDALPGQNVTFVLFGDTTVDNPTPDMRAVTVNTRIGEPVCVGAPNSALLIQAPQGTQVQMNINGADLTLGSTAFVTAQQNNEMAIGIVEGTGILSVGGAVRVIPPGAQVRIPLGGTDGLQVSGPPSDVEPYDYDAIFASPLSLLERPVNVPPPIGNLFATPVPSSTAAVCAPRSDWTFIYTVPFGDTLSGIAARIGLSTATLAAGNCITNPNVLIAGQIIRAPVAVPVFVYKTRTPTLTPTATGTLTLTPTPTITPTATDTVVP